MSNEKRLLGATIVVAAAFMPAPAAWAVGEDSHGSSLSLLIGDTLATAVNPYFWMAYCAQPAPEKTLIGLNIAHGQTPVEVINDIGCDYVTYRVFASDDAEGVKQSLSKLDMPFRIQYMQVKGEVEDLGTYEGNAKRMLEVARELNCPFVPFRFPHRPSCGIETVSDVEELWAIANRHAGGVQLELYATGDLDLWWLCSLVKRLRPKPAVVHYWNFHDSARLACDDEKPGWSAAFPEQCHYAFCLFGKRISIWGTMIQKSRFARAYSRRHGIDSTAIHFDWPVEHDNHCEACQVEYATRAFGCHENAVEEMTWISYKNWSDVWKDGHLTEIGKLLKSLSKQPPNNAEK